MQFIPEKPYLDFDEDVKCAVATRELMPGALECCSDQWLLLARTSRAFSPLLFVLPLIMHLAFRHTYYM